MRALMWAVLTVAGLWSGYWFVGSWAVERGAAQIFADATAQGVTAENEGLRVAGFPNRFDLTVTEPRLMDPVSGFGWQGADLRLLAMTWKPWHVIALAPDSSVITTPLGPVTVTANDLRASLVVRPGPDLALGSTVIEATGLAIAGPLGQMSLSKVSFATAIDTSRQNSHRIGLRITDLTPDPAVSAVLPVLPSVLSGLRLDAHVLLSAPLDRHVAETLPEVTGVVLDSAELDWGPLQVTARGSVASDSDGRAEGKIDLLIENWRLLPDVLGQSGVLDPVLAPTLLRAFELMAKGNPDLETALTFRSGRTFLGPLPIGPAPRLASPG